MTVAPSGTGSDLTQLKLATARSNPYTVSAADVANGWTQPIEILWTDNQGNPEPFPDTNYTCQVSVQNIKGVNSPKALYDTVQFEILTDGSGVGGGRSQGIIAVVQLLTNAKAGDVLAVHAYAIHD